MTYDRVVVEHSIIVFCHTLALLPFLQEGLRTVDAVGSKMLKGCDMGIALLGLEMLTHEMKDDKVMVG